MKWFNNLKVGIRVLLSCLLFIILITAIAVQGMNSMQNADKAFQSFFADRFVPVRELNRIFMGILQVRINMMEQVIAVQLNNVEEFKNKLASTAKIHEQNAERLKGFMARSLTTEEEKIANDFTGHYENMKRIAVDFVDALKKRDIAGSVKVSDRWGAEYRKARNKMDDLIVLQQSIGEEIKEEVKTVASNVMMISIIILSSAVFIGVIVTIILARSVSNPVKKGLEFAQLLADGDLTQRMDVDQKDELGMLGAALNNATDNLEDLIASVIASAQNLAQAVEQISSGNQNLSQRTSEQASSLEEIASTIEETTATIKQNAGNADQANEMSGKSTSMAEEGGRLVSEAVSSINEINQSSKKIGDIISVINEIAFQTNLLALNAAVEAARAGEQGRGFAVVAGEVRNLAQRSGNAAKEIGGLINDSLEKVGKGTELVNKSGEALKEIIESVKGVGTIISEIAAASQEQKQGVDQVNTAVGEMDSMTQQNASLVEETASASEEMANQAQDLLKMVEKFKVREQASVGRNASNTKQKQLHLKAAEGYNMKKTNTEKNTNNTVNANTHQIAQGIKKTEDQTKDIMVKDGFEEF